MAERGTEDDFVLWVEPHLTALARYAARRVAPADRDDVVREALIRTFQRWSTYDASGVSPVAWLLAVVPDQHRTHDARRPATAVVELVEATGTSAWFRDVDLERAVDGLGRRERQTVDLHYFVGLDVADASQVMHAAPDTVEATLEQSRDHLARLVGEDVHLMEERLSAAGRRWQVEQPPPPEVPVDRLHESLPRQVPWRRLLAAGAAVVLLGAGSVAVVQSLSGDDDVAPRAAGFSPLPRGPQPKHVVPFRDLEPGHPALLREENGKLVTPYDDVSASGDISGSFHPGDTLEFDAVLESPGFVSLRPCPDYSITIGSQTTIRRLNCAAVPYFASLVRSNGKVTSFRPVLPAGTDVHFHMRVTVPDQPGRQQVLWTLVGPHEMPGFSGVVEVTLP